MNKAVLSSFLALACCAPNAAIHAEEFDSQKYFTVGRVTVEEVQEVRSFLSGNEGFMALDDETPAGPIPELNEAEVVLDQIINMGRKIWTIVDANRPVVNVAGNVATAVPQGLTTWQQLQGWQTPTSKTYRVLYENLYGIDVVDFSFRVLFTHGGNLNGKGRYLTNVTIVPASLDVAWGYTFSAQSIVPNVVNTGSTALPVAGMELQLKWTVDTVLKHSESTASFFVRGDGQFTQL